MKQVPIPRNFDIEDIYGAYSKYTPEPNIIVVSPEIMSAIKGKFQAHQRFYSNTLGYTGLRFHKATIVSNRHAPNKADIELVYEDEFDEFADWVESVRTEAKQRAKQPKNAALRKFLGRNRWERR